MRGARAHGEPRPERSGPRRVSRPDGRHEREAAQAAAVVARGGSVGGWSFTAVPTAAVQRQEAAKPKDEDEKRKEALKKAGEAALATPEGKKLKEKVLADPLVKTVTDAVTSTPGLITGGAALAGGLVALGAAGKELPIQPPEIPGEKIHPKLAGITAKITYEGPVAAPTNVGLTITVKEQGPKGKKAAPDPIAADIARLKAQEELFRKGRTYAPGSKEAEEERLLDQAVQNWVLSRSALPGFTIPLTPPKQEKKKEEAPAQPAPASASVRTPAVADVDGAFSAGGRPLDPQTRQTMEGRFGRDLSRVRVHDDARAAATAAGLGAAAFTVGEHIAFGAARFSPASAQGRELLAHELAHTIQQRGATGKAPPLAPGSPLEARAADAGRAAAAGRRVTTPLGRSGRAVACQRIIGNENLWMPEHLRGAELEEFNRLFPLLRKGSDYPGRIQDYLRFEQLRAFAKRRHDDRRTAVEEAEALVAGEAKDDDDEEPRAAPKAAKERTPARFAPGGFTDEDIYREANEQKARLDYELGPPRDPRPFEQRFKEARRKAPITQLTSDYPASVWSYGREKGLFAPREEQLVRSMFQNEQMKKAERSLKRQKVRAAQRQQDEFRAFRSNLNLMFIQGALMGGPKAPPIVRVPYVSYGLGHSGAEIYRGVQSGDPTRVVGATLPLVAGYGFNRMATGEPLIGPQRLPGGRGGPHEVSPAEVRAVYRGQPDAVKKNVSNDFHQQVWEWQGGTGKAPLAFRAGRVLQVNEARWHEVGKLSEINQPHELIGAPAQGGRGSSVGTARTLPDPNAPTVRGQDPGTARTAVDPNARTAVDPNARTQPAQSGAARTPADPNARTAVDPNAPTLQPGPPGGGGTQPSAPPVRRPAPPPQRPARQPATPVTVEDAVAAYGRNPGAVHRSVSSDWHEQVYRMDRGRGEVPAAFRSGNTIIVDPSRVPPALLPRLGMAMRLP